MTFKPKHNFIYWFKLALFEPDCNTVSGTALKYSNIKQ